MDEYPAASEKLQLDEQGRLDEDIACRKCGYNLRGLLAESVCPECGTAVGRSTHGDLLRFCDPAWVGTLASGMNWMVAGIICSIGIAVLSAPLIYAMMTMNLSAPHAGALIYGLNLAVELVGLIGYWKVTTPDPGRVEAEPTITARSLARIAWVSSFVLLGIMVAVVVLAALAGWQPEGALRSAIRLIGYVQPKIGLIATIATYAYARQLAMRIPDKRLAISTRAVMWLFIIMIMLVFVVMPLAGVGFLVVGIATLILIVRYRRALSRAAGSGRSGIP